MIVLRGRHTGRTPDGFWKPEICAPGRMMVGPIPMTSSLAAREANEDQEPRLHRALWDVVLGAGGHGHRGSDPRPEPRVEAGPGQGRSDAASPCCSARRGQLVRSRSGQRGASGVQLQLDVQPERRAEQVPVDGFAHRREGLQRGQLDGCKQGGSVSWDAVSWTDVSWSDVSWDAVSWSDVSWTDVSWTDVSWSDVSWEDAGNDAGTPDGSGVPLTPEQEFAAARGSGPSTPCRNTR